MSRTLGHTGIQVSDIGFGCWAIGGPFTLNGKANGWGDIDDSESVAAIRHGLELGVTFFDTADVYGAGHSEEILGTALGGHRDEVTIATKFGYTFDTTRRAAGGQDVSADSIRRACEASLRRLATDRIDLYQLHVGDLPVSLALDVAETLDGLRQDGLIRAYGWSTDDPGSAAAFAKGTNATAIQHDLNVLADAPAMLAACEEGDLASINRTPLAMGLLTGKFRASSELPADDVRASQPWVRYFSGGRPNPEWLARLSAVRDLLTEDGRTPAQGAISWLLGRSSRTIPIPGVRTAAQAWQNAMTLQSGPLKAATMTEIERILNP
jgi:aryl-alcohol dehydrogenase-like predicted oxidoreductase